MMLPNERVCGKCRTYPPQYDQVRAWGVFEDPLRLALHQLKYKRDLALGVTLAQPLIDLLQAIGWDVDAVVPVPLGPARQKERGYNQAALLARPIALAMGWPYNPGSLRRNRETRSQVGLTMPERRANVDGAFTADKNFTAGKNILVVDDILTTGATLNACAQALVEADAQVVWGVTLARARSGLMSGVEQ